MSRFLILLSLSLMMACKPTWEDYAKESNRAFQSYLAGNIATAKAALPEEEMILAKHEAAGNRGVDYRHARFTLYARLCAVASHVGQTKEAQEYFNKAMAHRESPNAVTMADLLAAIERLDQQSKPKWRQQ